MKIHFVKTNALNTPVLNPYIAFKLYKYRMFYEDNIIFK